MNKTKRKKSTALDRLGERICGASLIYSSYFMVLLGWIAPPWASMKRKVPLQASTNNESLYNVPSLRSLSSSSKFNVCINNLWRTCTLHDLIIGLSLVESKFWSATTYCSAVIFTQNPFPILKRAILLNHWCLTDWTQSFSYLLPPPKWQRIQCPSTLQICYWYLETINWCRTSVIQVFFLFFIDECGFVLLLFDLLNCLQALWNTHKVIKSFPSFISRLWIIDFCGSCCETCLLWVDWSTLSLR